VLTDPSTELAIAKTDAAAAPGGRFVWIELPAGAPSMPSSTRDIRTSTA
jgi:hypothetical protein